jgi:hypothetical protein
MTECAHGIPFGEECARCAQRSDDARQALKEKPFTPEVKKSDGGDVSSYCPRCETQAELIAEKDKEIERLKKELYELETRELVDRDHIHTLTAKYDTLREEVENLMEDFAIDDDTAYVSIEAYHRLQAALDGTSKGECPKSNLSSEQRRHLENTITLLDSRQGKAGRLNLDTGKAIGKAVDWIKIVLEEKEAQGSTLEECKKIAGKKGCKLEIHWEHRNYPEDMTPVYSYILHKTVHGFAEIEAAANAAVEFIEEEKK